METFYGYDFPAEATEEDALVSGILLAVIVLSIFSAILTINIQTDFAMDAQGQIQQDALVAAE